MTRNEAVNYIANDLGYGRDNAAEWVLHAGFNGSWAHPAGALVITWDEGADSYSIRTRPIVLLTPDT